MEIKQPIPCGRGFENLPLSAQALWFHLAVNAHENGVIHCLEAKRIRVDIGASDEDVKALMRNRFITAHPGGGLIQVEQYVTYPGLVVERNGEDILLSLFHRVEIWRQRVADYERAYKEWRRQHGLAADVDDDN